MSAERLAKMKKDELMQLGLDSETAEKVAAASAEELKGFVPLARFNEVNEARKHAEDSLKDRDKQIDGLKASAGDAEKLRSDIERLQAENRDKDKAHAAEIKQLRIDAAVDAALTSAKAKNLKAARALLDLDKAELDEAGGVKGLAEQIQKLQGSDDSKFLFDDSKPTFRGAKTGEQGIEHGDEKPDFSKMGYEELAQYLAENPDVKLE